MDDPLIDKTLDKHGFDVLFIRCAADHQLKKGEYGEILQKNEDFIFT